MIRVAVEEIRELPGRMRNLVPEIVSTVMLSFKAIGQQQAIIIRPAEGDGYCLVAGRHRLHAARGLNWESIMAVVVEGKDDDEYRLIEIDENLARGALTVAEEAAHHAERKAIYLRKYPETKRGGSPGGVQGKRSRRISAEAQSEKPQNAVLCYVEKAAADIGTSRDTVERAVARGEKIPDVGSLARTSLDQGVELDALAKLPKDEQQALAAAAREGKKVSAKTRLKQLKRDNREKELAEKFLALPDKKYGVIMADPPWRFKPRSRETGLDRSADNHYPTVETTAAIGALVNMDTIAADDCVLALWATVPMLPDAIELMEIWGFKYKSHIAWFKLCGDDTVALGTGYWFRNSHELLLFGTRGDPMPPAPGQQCGSVIEAVRGRHSQKPDAAYEVIEAYWPRLPRIELNARCERRGWDRWGNEAPPPAAGEPIPQFLRRHEVPLIMDGEENNGGALGSRDVRQAGPENGQGSAQG
jgi:N6-adenosine-specific RNA methylase IME4